ncbi:MAG: hypothetical protein HOH95_14900 [Dehalococcoidia bacterium]|nr:hypothetical protein [Dehalococcoidia bacterium]
MDRRDLQLSQYLDDDLSAQDRDALETTLAADPQLADALRGMRQIRDTLATLETVRAPRSFAIPASSASVPTRAGFGRFELVARFGAVAAAVAFAAVLFGDVSGPTLTSSDAAFGGSTAQRAAAPAAIAESDTSLYATVAAVDGAAGGSTDDATDGDAQTQAAAATATPASTTSPLIAPTSATPPPTEGTASLETTSGSTGETTGTGGAATSGSNDAQPLSADAAPTNDTAVEEPGAASAPADSTAQDLPDRAVDSDATVIAPESTGTDPKAPTLGTQAQESSLQTPALQPMPGDEALSPFQADQQGISALAIALGAVTAILASASVLLWWQQRKQTAGPA